MKAKRLPDDKGDGALDDKGDSSYYPSSFILHPSSFILHPSSFILHPSSFILHPSSFILHHPSFILHPSSFILHPSSLFGSRIRVDIHRRIWNTGIGQFGINILREHIEERL